MWILHKILIYIPDVGSIEHEACDTELIDSIRSYARIETEDFYPSVFDYRETENADSCDSNYPNNVLLAKNNTEKFIQELMEAKEAQHCDLYKNLSELENILGTDLKEIIPKLENMEDGFSNQELCAAKNALVNISDFLYGTYRPSSSFYNTHTHTARIYKDDITTISANPNDWALVIFNYHC